MSDYIKLAEAPCLTIRYPECGACGVEVEGDDGFKCPVCGTTWDYKDGEDTPGTLFEEWSGEALDGDALTEEEAGVAGTKHAAEERAALWERLGIKPRMFA